MEGPLGKDLLFLGHVGSVVKVQYGEESEKNIKCEDQLQRALGPALGMIERPPRLEQGWL